MGWTIGTGASDLRVCRFSSDADGSGAIDANIEHPADYGNVSGPLTNQSFLVIGGARTCPARSSVRVGGEAGDAFVNLATVQHQP